MKEIICELIEEGEDLWVHRYHEFYEEHIEDYYLRFTTKAKLVFRKLVPDPLELEKEFNILDIQSFDEGQLYEILNLLKKAKCYFEIDTSDGFWHFLQPLVTKLAKDKFEQGHYADAVETVFKEINLIIKKHYKNKTGVEEDGATLMNRAFSVNNPLFPFDDITTETGRNIQQGYMQIFAGAMTGIRNPKAHNNMTPDKNTAMNLLFVASFMMLKLEDIKLIYGP
jgi:uncharacterized protein (TIGR02391 family)